MPTQANKGDDAVILHYPNVRSSEKPPGASRQKSLRVLEFNVQRWVRCCLGSC